MDTKQLRGVMGNSSKSSGRNCRWLQFLLYALWCGSTICNSSQSQWKTELKYLLCMLCMHQDSRPPENAKLVFTVKCNCYDNTCIYVRTHARTCWAENSTSKYCCARSHHVWICNSQFYDFSIAYNCHVGTTRSTWAYVYAHYVIPIASGWFGPVFCNMYIQLSHFTVLIFYSCKCSYMAIHKIVMVCQIMSFLVVHGITIMVYIYIYIYSISALINGVGADMDHRDNVC